MGRDDDLVPVTDTIGDERKPQRLEPRPDRDAVASPHECRELLFERLDFRAEHEPPSGHHAPMDRIDLD